MSDRWNKSPGDFRSQFGGSLLYAILLTSVASTYAYLNLAEGQQHMRINQAASKHFFISELRSNMSDEIKCPAGGIKIKQGSCPGSPDGPRTSPIVLSIQEVRRLAMVGESLAGLPFGQRRVGIGARDRLVVGGLREYGRCDIDLVPYNDPRRNPSPTPCVMAGDIASRVPLRSKNIQVTQAVSHSSNKVIPEIDKKTGETEVKKPPVIKKIDEATVKIRDLEDRRQTELTPVDAAISNLNAEISSVDGQLYPAYQTANSLTSQIQGQNWLAHQVSTAIQNSISACREERQAVIAAARAAKVEPPPLGTPCPQRDDVRALSDESRRIQSAVAQLHAQLSPVNQIIGRLESRKSNLNNQLWMKSNQRQGIVNKYERLLDPWRTQLRENELLLSDLNIETDNYRRMKEHLLEEVIHADTRLASNDRLSELGASPGVIKKLLLEGHTAVAGYIQRYLSSPPPRESGEIESYPLLLEPVCLASPELPRKADKYLRRLSFKGRVDSSRVGVKEQKKIADLKNFGLLNGAKRDLPVALAPDCVLNEEQDDEKIRLDASSEFVFDDALKHDSMPPPSRAGLREALPKGQY